MKQAHEGKREKKKECREFYISISDLVGAVYAEDGRCCYLGLLGKVHTDSEGRKYRICRAIGGGTELTDSGKNVVHDLIRGNYKKTGRDNPNKNDARFVVKVPKGMDVDAYVANIQNMFTDMHGVPRLTVRDVDREVREELGPKVDSEGVSHDDSHDIFTHEEVVQVQSEWISTLSPRAWREDSTERGKKRQKKGIESRRVFNMYRLRMPNALYDKLLAHPDVHVITHEEYVLSKEGATRLEGSVLLPLSGESEVHVRLAQNVCLMGDYLDNY